jgi:hypothetical protein
MKNSEECLSASPTDAPASSAPVPHKMTEKIIKWLRKSQNHWGKHKMTEHYGKMQRMTERLSHWRPCLLHHCALQNDWENHKITEENTKWLSIIAKSKEWLSVSSVEAPVSSTPVPHKMTEKIIKWLRKSQNHRGKHKMTTHYGKI